MTTDPERVTLDEAYALATPDDSRALYARWAPTYEDDFVAGNGYVIPTRVAEVFADVAGELAASGEPVLDVGCGTGLLAAALVANAPGGWVVDGVDISAQMISVAAGKARDDGSPVYRRLIEADLTGAVPIVPGTYAGMASSGTFTHGHLGPDTLATLVPLGRPGAIFAIGINAEHYRAKGFDAALARLLAGGAITDLTPRIVQMYLPGSVHEGETAVVAVFRRV